MEPEIYDAFFQAEDRHWWFRARRRIITTVMDGLYPRSGDLEIADVGCGTGGMAPLLEQFGRVTGVDEAPQAREYCARRGLDRVLTPEAWQKGEERYDLITSFDVVEHVEDDIGFLRDLGGRLSPGGRMLVTVPAYPFLWSVFDELNHHKRRYTRGTLGASLRGAGLTVERMTHFNTLLFPPIALVRLAERTVGRDDAAPEAHRRSVDRWFRVGAMNGMLETIFASERHWIRDRSIPVGCSILALARPGGAATAGSSPGGKRERA
jgi:2-polyprenyl-3-methyl-5-hydroxy-6-metoxy-1,4-benzoquinol methylase